MDQCDITNCYSRILNFFSLLYLPFIIWVIVTKMKRHARHVECTGENKSVNLLGREHFGDAGIGGGIMC